MNLEDVEITLNAVVTSNQGAWGVTTVFGNAQARNKIIAGDPFVQVDTDILTGSQKSMGAEGTRDWRRQGVMTFTVYVPVNSGTIEQKRVHQKIIDTFEGNTFTGIVFQGSSHRDIGIVDNWSLKSLRLDFYFNITGR